MDDASAGRGIGHPSVRGWVRRHRSTPFRQTADDPALLDLCQRLGLGPVVRDLSGEDNLTLLVDSGRHVLRTYKPFVTRRRLVETQRLRQTLAASGLSIPAPVRIGHASLFLCGPRWAEVEPFFALPSTAGRTAAETLFNGLGRLHRALAGLPALVTHDLRPSFVSCPTLLRWVSANVADGLMDSVRANDLRRQMRRLSSRWVDPADLPVQIIHTDPHAGNILATETDDFIYLDLGGVETAPRIHDLAIAFAYLLAATGSNPEEVMDQLPALLDAYMTGARSGLSTREHEALAVYTAAVAIYYDICEWGHGWSRISARLLDSAIS